MKQKKSSSNIIFSWFISKLTLINKNEQENYTLLFLNRINCNNIHN